MAISSILRYIPRPIKNILKKVIPINFINLLIARRARSAAPIPPTHISIEPTNFCNLRCSYCPKSHDIDRASKGYIAVNDFETYIDRIAHKDLKRVDLVGFGELFLHKEWKALVDKVNMRLPGVVITTNALMLDLEKFKYLVEKKIGTLNISLNATTREIYKEINGVDKFESVYNCIDEIVRYYSTLKDHPIRVCIQVIDTINPEEEIAKFRAAHKHWFSVDNVFFYVHPYANWGGLINSDETLSKDRHPCGHLYVPGITWEGEVYACCAAYPDGNKDMLLGNLKENTLEEIYKSEKFKTLDKLNRDCRIYDEIPICKNCNSWKRVQNVFIKNPTPFGPRWL